MSADADASVLHGLYKSPSGPIRYVAVHDVPGTLSGNILRLRASLPWSPPPHDSLLPPDKIRGNDISEISDVSATPLRLFVRQDDSEEYTVDDVAQLSPATVAKLPLIVYDERIHSAKSPGLSSEIVNLLQAQEHKLPNVVVLVGRTADGRIVIPRLNNGNKRSAHTAGVITLNSSQYSWIVRPPDCISLRSRDRSDCPEIADALALAALSRNLDLSSVPYSEKSDVYMFGRLMTDVVLSNTTRTYWQGIDGGNWLPPAPFRSVVLDCARCKANTSAIFKPKDEWNTSEPTPSSSHAGPPSPGTDPTPAASSALANLFDALATAAAANGTSTPVPSPSVMSDHPNRPPVPNRRRWPRIDLPRAKLRSVINALPALSSRFLSRDPHRDSSHSSRAPGIHPLAVLPARLSPAPFHIHTPPLLLTRPRPARPSTSLPPPTRPPAHTSPRHRPRRAAHPETAPHSPLVTRVRLVHPEQERCICGELRRGSPLAGISFLATGAAPRVSRSAAHANPAGYPAHLQIGDTGAFDVRLAGAALYLRRGALPRFVLANDDSSLLSPTALLATALAKYHVPRFLRPHLKNANPTPLANIRRPRPPTNPPIQRTLPVPSCPRRVQRPPPPPHRFVRTRYQRARVGRGCKRTSAAKSRPRERPRPASPKVGAVSAPPHVDASALPPKSFCDLSSPCPHAFRLAERVRGRYAQRPPRRPPQSHIDPPRKSLRPHPRRQPSPSISAPSPALAARLKALSRTSTSHGRCARSEPRPRPSARTPDPSAPSVKSGASDSHPPDGANSAVVPPSPPHAKSRATGPDRANAFESRAGGFPRRWASRTPASALSARVQAVRACESRSAFARKRVVAGTLET
ncbi:hypothetical protein B0H17DRAFT_1207198 [Mycena rosella]|uniref:Uncharacterized protein n=1 Tax=Mycena rosella TaxID=1033263 RepID=A0AAD7D434_MYCRO|nr:hypothetical protein B0H17DRAFT_1207198 [Mycena rosella]